MIWLKYLMLFTLSHTTTSANEIYQEAFASFIAGQYKQTEQQLHAALPSSPQKDQCHYILGRLAYWQRDIDTAFEHFEKAIEINPSNAHYHYWLGMMYGQKAIKANIFKKPGHARNSKRSFERTIAIAPHYDDARVKLIEYHLQAPGILGGDKEEARAHADTLKNNGSIWGYASRAAIYQVAKETENVEKEYQAAYKLAPQNPLANLWYSNHLSRTNRQQEGIHLLEQFLQIDSHSVQICNSLSRKLRRSKQLDQAYEVSVNGIKNWQDTSSIRQNIIDPIEQFDKIIDLQHHYLTALYDVGRLAAESGDHLEQGLAYLKTFLSILPTSRKRDRGRVYNQIGHIYLHQNKAEDARNALETALKYDPEHKAAQDALKKLK
ncbi:MAG: tetratricopeptide (TPR) repeat protein [Candidatus Latescibacterota bacterium]|jgi:tetratricopeptide (TPR) repeat protein